MQKYQKMLMFIYIYISVIKINDETFVADQFYKGVYFLIAKDMDISTILCRLCSTTIKLHTQDVHLICHKYSSVFDHQTQAYYYS